MLLRPFAPLWGAFKYFHKSIPAGFRVVYGNFTSHCCLASLATPCGTVCSYMAPPDVHSPHCLWDFGEGKDNGLVGHILDRSDNNGIVRLDPV